MGRKSVGLLISMLGMGLLLVIASRPAQVYTVPQVLDGLARDPQAWAGRAVLVWGAALRIVPDCQSGQWCPTGLYKPRTSRPGPILLLEPGPPDLLTLHLRRLPFVKQFVPGPQQLRWHAPAAYHVLFQVVPNTTCDAKPCINALLVDVAL